MSNSLGNFFTLRDLLKKGYNPRAIRYELLSTHYRQKMDFREENLKKIPLTLQKFDDFFGKLEKAEGKENSKEVGNLVKEAKEKFEKAMDDDLNISAALAAVFEFMTKINKIMGGISSSDAGKIKKVMLGFDSVLGVMEHEKEDIPKDVIELAEKRIEARKQKDWELSDKLRDEIKEKGYTVDDTKDGYRLKKSV